MWLWLITGLTAAVMCTITFYATGGLNLETMTFTEMALTLGSAALVAVALIIGPSGRRRYGMWPMCFLLALTALTAISVAWSVQPDESWRDAGRMLAYSAVFGGSLALVRIAPTRWPAILGGLVLASVLVCGYALLTKIFPASLDATDTYARLQEPFGYWNAVGLTAAMGAIGCMWLGARRTGHALLTALAYPALGLLLLTLVLAYSRGALAALLVGLVLWFVIVPLRLRGAALLAGAGIAAALAGAWDFKTHALSAESVARTAHAAGHQLGVLVLVMLLVLLCAGVAVGFITDRHAASALARRRAGATIFAVIALAALIFAGALAHSQSGLTGSISHALQRSHRTRTPSPRPTRRGASRQSASVRARYWKEALQVFEAHPVLGAGARRLPDRPAALPDRDTGSPPRARLHRADAGRPRNRRAALALGLLLTWMAAAGRPTHPLNRRWGAWSEWLRMRSGGRPGWRSSPQPYSPERIGMLSMLCLVVVFGAHSLVDWTWYVPGDACVALLCAGWLAGRGELAGEPRSPEVTAVERPSGAGVRAGRVLRSRAWRSPPRCWRSGPSGSRSDRKKRVRRRWRCSQQTPRVPRAADSAVSRDPLSVEALFALAGIEQATGSPALAHATLQHAVRLQPSNPETWLTLARYDLKRDPSSAIHELQASIYLNPESIAPEALASRQREAVEIYNAYIEAIRAEAAVSSANASRARADAGVRRAARRRG